MNPARPKATATCSGAVPSLIAAAVERDKFLSPTEAKTFGLIDEVVVSRPPRDDEAKPRGG